MSIPRTPPSFAISDRAADAVVAGGEAIDVTLRNGKSDRVTVRLLALSLLPRYQQVMNNEAESIALFVDRPVSWVDSLDAASQARLLESGEALNLDPLSQFAERQQKHAEKINPGMIEALSARLLAKIVPENTASPNGSPSASAASGG